MNAKKTGSILVFIVRGFIFCCENLLFKLHIIHVILKARLPFDFRLSAGISDGFDGRELHLPLRSESSAILAVITEGLEESELEVELKSREVLSASEIRSAAATI
jgi:hypothetical protein